MFYIFFAMFYMHDTLKKESLLQDDSWIESQAINKITGAITFVLLLNNIINEIRQFANANVMQNLNFMFWFWETYMCCIAVCFCNIVR